MDVYLKEIFVSFQENFSVGRGSDLLEVKGINTAFMEALFTAIAELWRSCPWKRLSSKDLLGVKVGTKLDWKPLVRQPFKCIRFSAAARGQGLWVDVLRSEKDAVGYDGKPTKALPENGLLRITFGPETNLFPEVRRTIRSLGLEIAGPKAYPGIEVIYPSKVKAFAYINSFHYQNPQMIELRWLIACLKAITQVHPTLQMVRSSGASSKFEDLLRNVEFSLPTTAEGYYLAEDKSTVMVRVTYPPKVTINDIPKIQEADGDPSNLALSSSRQCVVCQKTLQLPERAPRCSSCKAVFYCGLICQKKDWREVHKDICDKYKGMMERSQGLKIKQFSFPVLDLERPCGWLEQIGLHNKGMWRRICKCYQSCPFGHLPMVSLVGGYAHAAAWALEHGDYPPDTPLMMNGRKMGSTGSSNLNCIDNSKCKRSGSPASPTIFHSPGPKIKSTDHESMGIFSSGGADGSHLTVSSSENSGFMRVQQWVVGYEAVIQSNRSSRSTGSDGASISGWVDYYHARGLSFLSPVAAILTYPLTVYHIATNICASTRSRLAKNKSATIHYLGPKGELDWLPAFAEIGHLLSAFHTGSLHIVMIGPEVPNSLSGEVTTLGERLRITYVQGLYHEEATALLPPHMVIALTAGLDRLETWAGDLRTIKEQAVPTFFTEYAESCCMNAKQVLIAAELPLAVPVTPNAFRSPVRCQIPFTAVHWYMNGFLFGVNV